MTLVRSCVKQGKFPIRLSRINYTTKSKNDTDTTNVKKSTGRFHNRLDKFYQKFEYKNLNPFDTHIENVPNLREFTSNANHKVNLKIFNQLKPVTPNDSFVSCTIFDTKGNNIGISKKFPKMQFLREHNLYPRDLRKVDTSAIDVAPQIMTRPPTTILINLLHIKALIKPDKVMIFDTSTPEVATKLGLFIYDLESKLKINNNVPFEFKVIESILINIMGYLEAELKTHIENCGSILSDLENQVDRKKLQDLLIKSKALQTYYQKVLLIKDVLDDLLDNDEDMSDMYLTSKPKLDKLNQPDLVDLENILEAYYSQCDEFVQHSGSLVNDIKSTEDIVNIILDANRNELMLFELKVSIYTLGITVATLIPAFYGMNLKNFIEDSNVGFGLIVLFSVVQGILLTKFNMTTLKKVQTLTMGGRDNRQILAKSMALRAKERRLRFWHWHKWHWHRLYWHKYWWHWKGNKYHHPTVRERSTMWKMLNDNRRK
ncbi:mitochondrial inner membrane magnesium transporter Mrs2p [[Candida] jaroonii]|uniref:Mitochondrial inner membrane magnesium transporter Mrs2p n=1 Tax=[Candida] jaroonii TaxID=467808 RepID=A0ACA9YAS2_9ASCO|nr:mitochondrial inner membrane magnesium transporter Mrs2p [[Candida] jaroonii]